MSAASCLLTEDQFLCSICLDVFTDTVSTPCGHNFCKACITDHWNIDLPYQCPNCKKGFSTKPKLQVNTLISEMAAQFRQSAQLIPEKVPRDVYSGSTKKTWMFFLTCLMCVFISWMVLEQKKGQAELIKTIKKKTEKLAEGFVKDLKQEISELKKRSTEVEQLYVAQQEKLRKQKNLLHESDLKRVQQYAVDVTFDPDTAHPNLILSDDGKQVELSDVKKNLPDNPERFDTCVIVLAKQSFSSGRFYYEVQVKGKTSWDLGVARESVSRKGLIILSHQNGYWVIGLRNENEYLAAAGPAVRLSLTSRPQKVGVFVDYEEGLVSFYDVDAEALIYSFTGCSFTEKLYPYFYPGPIYEGGKNSAPLIISPVSH